MRQHISFGPNVPPSRAGISHAVVINDICYIGGQLSVDMLGRYRAGTAEAEAINSFLNLFAVLSAAGFEVEDLVFLGLALAELDELPAISAIYNRLFRSGKRPARTVEQAAGLPYGARFRVNGVAIRESRRLPCRCICCRQSA
ncbi:RidA family protein [Methylobacterium sp. SyP6R]|uniref:RidA family protein n=1 Tax=Methylobacterium sp. SyP6R TaxID=2718876 RepID=UPI001F35239A|nr:RidA family protein [Methylobacterium sp. SyP6R]MCF4126198.1 RidA family protein [Methylobacterium sp. SyP6R]